MDQPARRVVRGIPLALAVLLLFFAQRNCPRRVMRRDDPSTWPASTQPCVTWFDIEVHQRQIGFSLARQRHRAGEARWDWEADGIEGELRLSIWPTAREGTGAWTNRTEPWRWTAACPVHRALMLVAWRTSNPAQSPVIPTGPPGLPTRQTPTSKSETVATRRWI